MRAKGQECHKSLGPIDHITAMLSQSGPPCLQIYSVFFPIILPQIQLKNYTIFLRQKHLDSMNLNLISFYHINTLLNTSEGLPRWLSGKESSCQRRRHRFNLWVRKIPWRRKWQTTPVFLHGKSHRQRSLAGYTPWGHRRVGHDWTTKKQEQTHLTDTWRRLCLCWPDHRSAIFDEGPH